MASALDPEPTTEVTRVFDALLLEMDNVSGLGQHLSPFGLNPFIRSQPYPARLQW
jgi:hypothetical protein